MKKEPLDKKVIDSSELTNISEAIAGKKQWQAPTLFEVDYRDTNAGSGKINDGGGFS